MPLLALAAWLVAAPGARADYDSHPELRPEKRCAAIPAGVGAKEDPGGPASIHCQRLYWDLPAANRVGLVAAAAPLPGDRRPAFPKGLTDRPPPLYVVDRDGDGVADDGEGYEEPGPGRVRLCPDPDEIPWWKPLTGDDGKPLVGKDPTHGQEGPLHEVACRRGTRVRFGPWQGGTAPDVDEALVQGPLRFESSARLDRDVKERGLDEAKHGRREWHTGTESYNHFSVHHAVCWYPENALCNDPENPWAASDPGKCREGYQEVADGPDAPNGKGACYAGDQDTRCRAPRQVAQTTRHFAVVPGRSVDEHPRGQAEIALEDQLWWCYHHLTHDFPPDTEGHDPAFQRVSAERYGLDVEAANHRLQKGGLVNVADVPLHGAPPGGVIGGVVGEMTLQFFTEPFTNPELKPLAPRSAVRSGGLADYFRRKAPGAAGLPSPPGAHPHEKR